MVSFTKNYKDIEAVELVEARTKEIQYIEESIKKSNKKTMLFQRLPFYKRRRNRNYDKRTTKKFTYRKKDRHFLRTHTYYAKRFFMLKLHVTAQGTNTIAREESARYTNLSIPMQRRIKSSKYIYKSQDRGFLFDESFRGGFSYDTKLLLSEVIKVRNGTVKCCIDQEIEGIVTMTKVSLQSFALAINLDIYNQVQTIDNLYDVILTKSAVYVIGAYISNAQMEANIIDSVLTVINKEGYMFYELKDIENCQIYPNNNSFTILCTRTVVMDIYQALINNSIVPICLDEIHRLSVEHDQLTVYDNIKCRLYQFIEQSYNQTIVEKYNNTPKSKKQAFNTDDLYISKDVAFNTTETVRYCVFKAAKGCPKTGGFIYMGGTTVVGRVIRCAYKYTNGKCYGLCAMYPEFNKLHIENTNTVLSCQNLGQSNTYGIEIIKTF